GRLVMVSPVSGIYAKVRQKFHLSPLFKFPEPALGSTHVCDLLHIEINHSTPATLRIGDW
ncbi:hypothetical protein, partial [Sinorhizobium meliloti]|uniref:hypothetical protein n=1 Tax=Rhizobium meliloti TaxID=382 RepID=UPI001AECCEE1